MSVSYLTTSGINTLVNSYIQTEESNQITPLQTKQTKYTNMSTAYSSLSTKLDSLKSSLSTLKATGTSSAFTSKTATLSSSSFFTASVTDTAALSTYDLRVDQLAKSDTVVTSTVNSSDTNSSATGTHTLTIKSGDYTSNIDVDFGTDSLTNTQAMAKLRDAVNSDKAVVTSSSVSGDYTGAAGSFTVDLNGTEKTITYDSGKSYSDIMDSVVSQLNGTSGLTVEKVADGSSYKLKFTVTDSSKYISIKQSSDTGDLLKSSNLNIDVTKEKGASGLVSASVFSPTQSTSKMTLSAQDTGYSNRLQITSDSVLSSLGLTADVLSNRYKNSDDGTTTSSTKAGFTYGTQWLNTDSSVGGTAETESSNSLNSKIEFNGLTVQRDSNSISDLVDGVTFSLTAAMKSTDSDVTVAVKNDTSGVKSLITDFISKFNNVYAYLKTETSSQDGIRGPLISDASASSLISMLAGTAYSKVSGLSDGALSQLSSLGITFDSTSGLTLSDSGTLESAISEKASQVEAIFNSDNGIATTLYKGVNPYTGSGGYIASAKKSADSSVKDITDKISAAQTKIDKSAETLRTKYENLQSQLATLYLTQASLTGVDYSSDYSSLFDTTSSSS